MPAILSFVTEKHEDGLWLCTSDKDGRVVKIARFVSYEASQSFTDVLNLTRMTMHALGGLGI